MQLLKRVGFYLLGIALGVPVVMFVWKGKDVTFDYLPNARVLKNIRSKKYRLLSDEAKKVIVENNIDSVALNSVFVSGKVLFDKSEPRKKPCGEFFVQGNQFDVYVIRCDSTVTISNVIVK